MLSVMAPWTAPCVKTLHRDAFSTTDSYTYTVRCFVPPTTLYSFHFSDFKSSLDCVDSVERQCGAKGTVLSHEKIRVGTTSNQTYKLFNDVVYSASNTIGL